MDGDSRGGAALSVKAVSGKPIKFVGAGEKLEALEPFYPDRLTSRILGKHVLKCCFPHCSCLGFCLSQTSTTVYTTIIVYTTMEN